ncbi:uncharacterized protein ACHE_20263A [Aspergillus chevalieri]|uniref:Uncharacterized protein n=1 Tax=Aspergillus chevalieri TaxID=182096 RepID=A0A7R7VHF6_ASPCH|nr:uncharacterized protein ACHE_20263A [Aspergillus chevalieri]BCR84805.1 hypothetical protein ACHE_20263A [Aspergillus chevalieri]
MTMIRLRPTRIVPNRDDIHYHIEQIFDRLYERLRAFEPECYDDDFGDDLGSLIDADISSFRSSPAADEDYDSEASSAFDLDYEYKRYPSSQLEDYGIDDGIPLSDSRVIEHPHPRQYPRSEISNTTDEGSYGNGSYETAIDSGVGMQEDGMGLDLPSSRMNYGELTRAPHSPEENQSPQPSDKETTSKLDRDLDSKLVSFNEAKTRLVQLAPSIHQAFPNPRVNKMPGSIQDERNMSQTDIHMSDAPEHDITESGSNNTSCVSSTVSQNRGKRTRTSAGSRMSAVSSDTKSKRHSSQVPSEGETSSSISNRGAHTTGAASIQTGRTVSQWTELSRPVTRRTSWHPVNAPQGQRGRRQPANKGRTNSIGQGTTRTAKTAQTDTSSLRPTSTQGSAPLLSDNVQRPATSPHATPATQARPSTAQPTLTATAPAPAGINMPPQTALSPEKWKHMMEASQVYREHVNHMITEMEKDDDNANGFGLGELRRRPLGDMLD